MNQVNPDSRKSPAVCSPSRFEAGVAPVCGKTTMAIGDFPNADRFGQALPVAPITLNSR